jgi:hypothetical protein
MFAPMFARRGRNKPALVRHLRGAEPASQEPSQTSGLKERTSEQLPGAGAEICRSAWATPQVSIQQSAGVSDPYDSAHRGE